MERLKEIKNTLINSVMIEMQHPQCVNTAEMGEVIDMIKDIDEAMYYHSIVKAMEEEPAVATAHIHNTELAASKKAYVTSKEGHKDIAIQMKDLDNYLSNLCQEVEEMAGMATQEEKIMMQSKLSSLMSKLK